MNQIELLDGAGSVEVLTADESAKLQKNEAVIERGLNNIGIALKEIRDQRLYRANYATFEDYCRERWNWERRTVDRRISFAENVLLLQENQTNWSDSTSEEYLPLPSSEGQARPLSSLPVERRAEAWKKAVETAPKDGDGNPKVTGAHVASVVNEMRGLPSDRYERNDEDRQEWEESEDEAESAFIECQLEEIEHLPAFPAVGEKARFKEIATSQKTDEHYTPADIVDAVIECFEAVGLDPCSNSHENPNVPALKVFTIDDDGLAQDWKASTLYMNPPYSETEAWAEKLVKHYESGDVGEAIALVKSDNRVGWYATLMDASTAFCEYRGYIRFGDAAGSAPFASTIFYFGPHIDRFYWSFESLGWVCQVINPEMIGE